MQSSAQRQAARARLAGWPVPCGLPSHSDSRFFTIVVSIRPVSEKKLRLLIQTVTVY